jgi:hypothetical protein
MDNANKTPARFAHFPAQVVGPGTEANHLDFRGLSRNPGEFVVVAGVLCVKVGETVTDRLEREAAGGELDHDAAPARTAHVWGRNSLGYVTLGRHLGGGVYELAGIRALISR